MSCGQTAQPGSLTPAFTRLRYDDAETQTRAAELVGPAHYVLDPLRAHCAACVPDDAQTRFGTGGAPYCSTPGALVDVDSELHNITRVGTKAPQGKYKPGGKLPCDMRELPACQTVPTLSTRLTNPPCTLRGTGWNRFEWPCTDPQQNVEAPFHKGVGFVNSSLVFKDNHRPHVPKPLDPKPLLPPQGQPGPPTLEQMVPCAPAQLGDEMPLMQWRSCSDIVAPIQ